MEEINKSGVSGGCALKREAEEAEIVMKALAEEDCRAEKLASSAACDEEEMDRERDELIADIWMEMNRKAEEEMMAALEMVQEKKEQYKEVPLLIEKQDKVGVSLSLQVAELKQCSQAYLIQVEVPDVSGLKAEAETDKMQHEEERNVQLKKMLKEAKVTKGEKEQHELPPVVADKLLPPDREGSRAGVRPSVG